MRSVVICTGRSIRICCPLATRLSNISSDLDDFVQPLGIAFTEDLALMWRHSQDCCRLSVSLVLGKSGRKSVLRPRGTMAHWAPRGEQASGIVDRSEPAAGPTHVPL